MKVRCPSNCSADPVPVLWTDTTSICGKDLAPPNCIMLWKYRKIGPLLVKRNLKKKEKPDGTGHGISYPEESGRVSNPPVVFLVSSPPNPLAPPHPVAVLPTITQALGHLHWLKYYLLCACLSFEGNVTSSFVIRRSQFETEHVHKQYPIFNVFPPLSACPCYPASFQLIRFYYRGWLTTLSMYSCIYLMLSKLRVITNAHIAPLTL